MDPTEQGAIMYAEFSIALALFKICQWAFPVFLVNAEGTTIISAPLSANDLNRLGNLRS